jgi:hypothetical protein
MRLATWHQHLARAYVALGDIDNSWQHNLLALEIIGEHLPANFSVQWYSTFPCVDCVSFFKLTFGVFKLCKRGDICAGFGVGKAFRCGALSQLATLAILRVMYEFFPQSIFVSFIAACILPLSRCTMGQTSKNGLIKLLTPMQQSSGAINLQEDLQAAKYLSHQCLSVALSAGKELRLEVARAHSVLALVAGNTHVAKCHLRVCLEMLTEQAELLQIKLSQAGDIHHNLSCVYLFHGTVY